ncbi:DNA polymerase III subunit delta' [Hazenella coriacea]|uniref:DNA polymerase-3 subunit delta n=1 Tax=Hazenella coriacea TaxID=1179467 RepID=A0A4R3LA10_9BACL|nr:DNA polymerase III subunit delta' [Hazenella coriacea]TCS94326.1 DNA polymerase-3 subunit delta' [Hazenella coriacea]
MSFQQLEGQQQVVRILQNALSNHRVAHAYCFAGPKGVGKQKAAIEFAKALNCEKKQIDACDQCRNCRLIEQGNHPDLVVLRPEGTSIKIDQVRQIQKLFSYSPNPNFTRVIMIEQADLLNVHAANSLLKFLEEPLSPMVAILITEQMKSMLPTILSRCQIIRFTEDPPHRLAKKMEESGFSKADARILGHLSGKPDDLRKQLENVEFAEICNRVIEWSGEILSGNSIAIVSIQKEWLQKEIDEGRISFVLDILLLWLRELLYVQVSKVDQYIPVFVQWEAAREKQAYKWNRFRLLWGMETILRARSQLAGPMQPQAVLENMVLAMQEGSHSC